MKSHSELLQLSTKNNIRSDFFYSVSNWIFVISDGDDVFQKRINEKIWPIFENTHNKRRLRIGDRVIFYQAGKNGKKFTGRASVASKLTRHMSNDQIVLEDIEVWKNQVQIEVFIDNLNFVKNRKHWGSYFQGGVISLPDKDYRLIMSNAIRAGNISYKIY